MKPSAIFTGVTLTLNIVLILAFNFNGYSQHANYLPYVNPFIGTAKSNVLTRWGNNGGTYPGAVAPSGAVQLSPETRVSGAKGYDYADSVIYYFSCFKHFSGFPEGSSGSFFVMPVNTANGFEAGKYSRPFKHDNETASPGYYKVIFDDDHTVAEATASARAGMFRFTFPAQNTPQVFVGDAGEVTSPSKKIVYAGNANTVINFSEDYTGKKQVQDGWLFSFKPATEGSKVIVLKLSKSAIYFNSAQNNIDKELWGFSFDEIRKKTSENWLKQLSVVDVADTSAQNKTVFYTALYHSLLIPWVIDDADGRYRGADGQVHQKTGANQYGGFSPWDTFRSLHPLLTLLYPDKQRDVILSMLDIYKQTGHLPTESMTGNHAIPIIVDTYLKGITGFDKTLAYTAMKKSIVEPPFIQPDLEDYQQKGYIPFTRSESVTRTVEYAYDDWALSRYAESVMHNKTDYRLLAKRGYNYRNLLNEDELFMLPRNGAEFKMQPGMPGYKEGDKWVYTYFVPHNARDLINLMGGDKQFSSRLDSALSSNVILFDNETVFHLPYLFNQAGYPALTQKWCRQIMLNRFSATPGGLPGNDDLGSTSSWYIFSAMGIYPVCPGRPVYAIGSPLFSAVTLRLPGGKTFTIKSTNQGLKNNYIQSLTVNKKPWQQLILPHNMLVKGGEMIFNMGNKPAQWPVDKNPIELSDIKNNSKFKILHAAVSKPVVEPNEPFVINFTMVNSGSTGTKTLKLLLNGKEYQHQNYLLASGKTSLCTMKLRLYAVGKTILRLEGAPLITVKVQLPKVPVSHPFKINSLTLISMVKLNDRQQIGYKIQNTGGFRRKFDIPVMKNDSVIFTDRVELGPGEKSTIKHSFNVSDKGFQQIRVDSGMSVYKVYQENKESLILDLSPTEKSAADRVIDRSGFKNDGYILPEAKAGQLPRNGKLLFGDDAFVEVPNAPSLDVMGETISMMAWVYPTGKESGLVDIFTKGDSQVLQVSDGKTLTFFAGGWGRGDCTVNLPADWQNKWHHIAGVCTGNALYIYIDGILKGSTMLENNVNLSGTNKWTLGRNEEFPSERIYHGYINMAKVFKEALSAEDIASLFNAGHNFIKQ